MSPFWQLLATIDFREYLALQTELAGWKVMQIEAMAVATANRQRIRELEAALVKVRAELRGAGPSCSREFAEIAMQSAWRIAGDALADPDTNSVSVSSKSALNRPATAPDEGGEHG